MPREIFNRVAGGMAAIVLANTLAGCGTPRNPNTATPVPVTVEIYPTEAPPTPTEAPTPTARPSATSSPEVTATSIYRGTGGPFTPEQMKTFESLLARFKGYEKVLIDKGVINPSSENLANGWNFDVSFDPENPQTGVIFIRKNNADGQYQSGWFAPAMPVGNDNPFAYTGFDYRPGNEPFEVPGAEVVWAANKDGNGRQANLVRKDPSTKEKGVVDIRTMKAVPAGTATTEALATQTRPIPSATPKPPETVVPTATPEIRYKVAEYALNSPARVLNAPVDGLKASFIFTGTNDKASGFKIKLDNGQDFNLFDFLKPGIVAQLTDQNGKPSSSPDAQKIVEGVMEGTIEFSPSGLVVKDKDGKKVATFDTASPVARVTSIGSLNPSGVTGTMSLDSGKKPVEAPPAATQAPKNTPETQPTGLDPIALTCTRVGVWVLISDMEKSGPKVRIPGLDTYVFDTGAPVRSGALRAVNDGWITGEFQVAGVVYRRVVIYNGVNTARMPYQCVQAW